ncbi:hypothetical protein TBLA_0C02730 [Henningerozyma blattae CBS 6284]|uniref:Transporter n=1 Tax=Henningerozyma blattae (strain ATCC 34711 / CBS 6284 / DSM 70876 / NBRC 10599 / NRRL Y-10934 / UCD 77-7) TaxID=1071380 RepID=I2H129_HENB6|nr:hypothetical protein TBLA_0C02730 [Tetrapisispora blattae CBS 6284]CCH60081.1 hypothetical protein TBLA_0C02730 [Tetrapisispora blattae CBS 6284]
MEQFSFLTIAYLVFQSVLQVIIISFAGFWSAYSGLLPKSAQKVVSKLNVDLFTPCLIFSKLARSLSVAKAIEISIIPLFFILTTFISYFSGSIVAKFLRLNKNESNFIIGNSIFGNSNSLPVSLTVSLAYTLPDLTWDQIQDDTRDNVASRGLLYLLIFQQFGQMLRWSWGYNTLLRWTDGINPNRHPSILSQSQLEEQNLPTSTSRGSRKSNFISTIQRVEDPQESLSVEYYGEEEPQDLPQNPVQLSSDQQVIQESKWQKFISRLRQQLNPPLYSMIISVFVASVTPIQRELFIEDGFINNTLAEAVDQLGSVSIPLILIVLGSNLYPSPPKGENDITDDNYVIRRSQNHNKLVFGSIVGRMILPSIFLLPIITLLVKYINTSILDDPIFLVVGFLLTVSPPAIQLTQITQLNEFFEAEMATILFWGYVVLSLPVSIVVVSGAISVLQWANPQH